MSGAAKVDKKAHVSLDAIKHPAGGVARQGQPSFSWRATEALPPCN